MAIAEKVIAFFLFALNGSRAGKKGLAANSTRMSRIYESGL
jgi:hypothetical protein